MSPSYGGHVQESDPAEPRVGTAVPLGGLLGGRYRLRHVISDGGMGLLLLACVQPTGRLVVVKTPRPDLLLRPGVSGRFRREFRWLRRFRHPHLMPVLDVAETPDGVPYAVMPYLEGGNLRRRFQEGLRALSVADVAPWLRPVAAALDHLHDRGLVHRDVTPRNILFDADGRVVLTDLGLASLLEGPGGRARRPRLAGDPPYIPPEAMEHVGIRPAYDQYSLAVVAYEAFCGALPVSCEDGVAVLLRKRVEPPHPLAHRRPDLAPSTCGAVMRALDRDPARRFESCEEFAAAL